MQQNSVPTHGIQNVSANTQKQNIDVAVRMQKSVYKAVNIQQLTATIFATIQHPIGPRQTNPGETATKIQAKMQKNVQNTM